MSDFPESPYESQPSPEEPKKSGSGLKIFLWIVGIGGGLLLLACGGCVIGSVVFFRNAISDDPATIRETAQAITEINPPSGYEPLFSANMFGVKVVGYGQQDQANPRMLMLMSFPENMADEQQMRQQMNQSLQQQGQQDLREIESETRPYTIRGEECQVRIAKAEAENGNEVRQITAIFRGKAGPAMLMLLMPEEDWVNGGEEEFEKMLESMK